MKLKLFTLLLLIFISEITAKAQNPNITFTFFSSGDSTFNKLTDLANAGDSRMFVVEQTGFIHILDSTGKLLPGTFLNISDKVGNKSGEQGLLGLAFSPDYKTNGYFFVYYTDTFNHIRVSRFSVSSTNADSAVSGSEDTVLIIDHNPFPNHYGGNIAFGPDGYLYLGTGDGGYTDNIGDPYNRAQNRDTLLGKILRLDVSSLPYKIPPTNPYADGVNGRPEIWAYGLRNPWCWSFDRVTGDLWIADVGMSLYEEIDFQPTADTGGINYGWRCYEGDVPYNTSLCTGTANYTFPVYAYKHSNYEGCCIIGGYVYRGAQYKSLFGRYLSTDLCSGLFRSVVNNSGTFNENDLNASSFTSSTKLGQDIYGNLYIASQGGSIYKLGDTSCAPVAFISFSDTIFADTNSTITALYGQGLKYQWKFNNTVVGSGDTLTVDSTGIYTVTVTNGKGCSSSANQFVKVTTTGINKLEVYKNLQIIPNPNKGAFDLNVSVLTDLSVTISVVDVLGRTLLTDVTLLNGGKNTIHISEGNLPSGIYLVKINSQEGESVIKFVVTE